MRITPGGIAGGAYQPARERDGGGIRLDQRDISGNKKEGVSEVIGSLILVAIVIIGVAIIGVLLFSQPTPVKVPVFETIISNQSRTIYLYHKGGDPLWTGQYRILVDGGDQTGNFSFLSPGSDPWSVGETLTAVAPVMPKRVAIILNQSTGGVSVLALQDLVPGKAVAAPSDIMWYNYQGSGGKCYWQYRKAITIDGSKVAGTLSGFPVLVNLPSDAQLAGAARSDGNDILFTSADGTTKLDHEIESYTGSSGALIAWVDVPSLPAGTNTVIYMYYGNSTVGSQQNPTGVWDANYLGVYHLNNAFTSSTGSNNGANTNTGDAGGQIGRGRSFDGTGNQYITVTGYYGGPATVTLSAWTNLNTADTKGAEVISIQNNASIRMDDATGGSQGTKGFYFNWTYYLWAPTISRMYLAGAGWHYLTYVANPGGSSEIIYIDGVARGTSSFSDSIVYRNVANTFIGKHPFLNTYDFNGVIDEVRVSNSARTGPWIQTEYANQNSPSTFYSVGTEESWWKC